MRWTSLWDLIVAAWIDLERKLLRTGRANAWACSSFLLIAEVAGVISFAAFFVYTAVNKLETPFRCPCCGYRTLEAPDAMGLCPVCWWEDDGQEESDASEVRLTVNGQLSLSQARSFFVQIGAAHPRFLPFVRKPQLTEQ